MTPIKKSTQIKRVDRLVPKNNIFRSVQILPERFNSITRPGGKLLPDYWY